MSPERGRRSTTRYIPNQRRAINHRGGHGDDVVPSSSAVVNRTVPPRSLLPSSMVFGALHSILLVRRIEQRATSPLSHVVYVDCVTYTSDQVPAVINRLWFPMYRYPSQVGVDMGMLLNHMQRLALCLALRSMSGSVAVMFVYSHSVRYVF